MLDRRTLIRSGWGRCSALLLRAPKVSGEGKISESRKLGISEVGFKGGSRDYKNPQAKLHAPLPWRGLETWSYIRL